MTIDQMRYAHIQSQLDKSWRVFDPQRVTFLKQVLDWLDHPEQHYRIIQIAGTNGKGSTGAMLRSILAAADYRVGHFASPAVLTDHEQIWLNKRYITDKEFVRSYEQLVAVLAQHDLSADALSYFEVWFFVALMVFAADDLAYVIVEAGVGGLHDATNAIDTPAIVAFTEIGLDHQAILGDSLRAIAENKAALIKPNSIVVSDMQQKAEAINTLQRQAQKVAAVWYQQAVQVDVVEQRPGRLRVEIDGVTYESGLQGAFQVRNLALVWQILAVIEAQWGVKITAQSRQTGLQQAYMIGRLEVDTQQRIIWDGAHNLDAATALAETIRAWQLTEKPLLVLGVLADKDVQAIVAELLSVVAEVWTITPDNERGLAAAQLTSVIHTMQPHLPVHTSTVADVWQAVKSRQSAQQYIIVAGSFYTLRALRKE